MAVADVMRALGLRVRAGRPPAQPGQLRAGQVAADGVGRHLPLAPLAAGGQVAGVAVVVDVALAPVELEDAGGDPVEDVAVVGDEHQPAAEAGQAVLQPGDGVDVEVVGGLVEHEQVDLLQQGPGQRHPLGLAAGEGGHVGVAQVAHPQPVEDGGRLPPPTPRSTADRAPHRPRRQLPGAGRETRSARPVPGAPPPLRARPRPPAPAGGWTCRRRCVPPPPAGRRWTR